MKRSPVSSGAADAFGRAAGMLQQVLVRLAARAGAGCLHERSGPRGVL